MKKLSKDELRPKVNLAWPMAGVMDQIFDREIDIKEDHMDRVLGGSTQNNKYYL